MYTWRSRGKHAFHYRMYSAADVHRPFRPVCAMLKSVIVSSLLAGITGIGYGFDADADVLVEPKYFYDCRTPLRRTHSPSLFNHWRQTATPGKRYNSPNAANYTNERAPSRGGPPSSTGDPDQDATQELLNGTMTWDANPQSCVTGCGCVCNNDG